MNTIHETNIYAEWFAGLKDRQAKWRIMRRVNQAQNGNFGDHHALSDGISEMRLAYGPGYRMYYAQQGQAVYMLLCGGDKSSQSWDIAKAKRIWKDLQKEQA